MRLLVLAVAGALVLAGCGAGAAQSAPPPTAGYGSGSGSGAGSGYGSGYGATTVPAAPATPSAPARPLRVTSTVTSLSGGKLVLANGQTYDVTDQTRYLKVSSVSASSLKVGDYIAITGQRQTDNSVLATLINVFPPQLKGVAPGQRPLPGGNLMTTATIAAIKGTEVDVTWSNGGAKIILASNVKVTQMQTATAADVQAGVAVAVTYSGSTATSVTLTGQ